MLERRFLPTELRIDGKEQPIITGHAAVFNQKSEEIFGIKGMREVIRPGAFTASIRQSDIRALWNHDPNFVLGRNKSGTLELSEDEWGLAVRIKPPDAIFSNDILESIKRGDVDQMSFGFRTVTDSWRKEGGDTIRELIEVELFDVSPVTFPAYPQTDVSARELSEMRSFFEAKMRELPLEEASEEQKIDFLARKRAREEFISSRTPPEIETLGFTDIDTTEETKAPNLWERIRQHAPPPNFLTRVKSRAPEPDPFALQTILNKSRIK